MRGRVVDAQTEEVLPGATVALPDLDRGAVADADGAFAIPSLPAGTHALECSFVGYETARRSVALTGGQTLQLELRLAPQVISLREMTVTPGRFAIMGRQPEMRQALTAAQILALPHFGEDIYRAVTRLPGISGNEFSARFTVRGGEHDEVLVRLDGVQLYEPFHLKDISGGALSVVDVQAIEGIDLLTGGFPAEYGDRMSGVFDITSRTPNPGTQRHCVGLSFMNARVASEGTFERGSWLVSARRGYLDMVLWLAGEDEDLSPRYYDLLGKVQYQLSPSQRLSAHVLYARDDLDFTEDDDDANTTGYGNGYAWLHLTSTPGPHLLGETTLSWGRVTSDRRGEALMWDLRTPDFTVADHRSLQVLGLQQAWSWEVSDRHLLKAGADLRRLTATYDYLSTDNDQEWVAPDSVVVRTHTIDLDHEPGGYSAGVHLADRLRLHRRLTAEVGLRYDAASRTDDRLWSPRLNLIWTPREGTVLRGGWGRFYQSQGLHELDVPDGERSFSPAQRSEQGALGLERVLPADVQLRVEAYWRRASHLRRDWRNWLDYVEMFPEMQDDRVAIDRRALTSRGLEVFAKRDLGGRFACWASYALARVREEVTAVTTQEGTFPLVAQVPGAHDQRHTLYLDLSWRPRPAWHASTAWQYHTGWPYTPMVLRPFTGPDGGTYYRTEAGTPNGARYPAFHRLDVRVAREWRAGGARLSLYAEAMNLYVRHNVRAYDYEWRPSSRPGGRLVRRPVYWLGLLPSLGVSWSWER
ncbi:MAG: TonB-dependent receptor [Candidatus Latescibacterota bacterium]